MKTKAIKHKNRSGEAIVEGIKRLDQFGVPISLRYKGDTSYKTFCGGISTIIAFFVVVSYFAVYLKDVINRRHDIKTSTIKSDETLAQVLDKDNFHFEFMFMNSGKRLTDYYLYFNVSTYVQVSTQGDTRMQFAKNYLSIDSCSNATNSKMCLNFSEITLYGTTNSFDATSSILGIDFQYCDQSYLSSVNSSLTCYTTEETDSLIAGLSFQYGLYKRQFDQGNFTKPVSTQTSYKIDSFDTSIVKTLKYNVKRYDVTLYDSALGWLFQDQQYFYNSIYDTTTQMTRTSSFSKDTIYSLSFSVSPDKEVIERKVYSLWDALSAVGGMNSFISGLCSFIIGKLFNESLFLEIMRGFFFTARFYEKNQISKSLLKKLKEKNKSNERQEVTDLIYSQISGRTKFRFSFRDLWLYQLKRRLRSGFRICNKLQKRVELLNKKELITQKGIHLAQKELDIMNIVKKLRTLKIMSQIIMSKEQLKLLSIAKQNVLEYQVSKPKTKSPADKEHNLDLLFKETDKQRHSLNQEILNNLVVFNEKQDGCCLEECNDDLENKNEKSCHHQLASFKVRDADFLQDSPKIPCLTSFNASGDNTHYKNKVKNNMIEVDSFQDQSSLDQSYKAKKSKKRVMIPQKKKQAAKSNQIFDL